MKNSGWIGRLLTVAGATVLAGWMAHAAPQPANFTASAVKGTVTVGAANGKKALNVGENIKSGDTVTTEASSTADLAVTVAGKQVCVLHIWESSSYTVLDTMVDEGAAGVLVTSNGKVLSGSVSGQLPASTVGSSLTIEAGSNKHEIRGAFLVRSDGSVYAYSGQTTVTSGGQTYRISSGQYFNPASAAVLPHNLPKPVFVAGTAATTTTTETVAPTQVVSPTQPAGGGN